MSYSDPFGLDCKPNDYLCQVFKAGMTVLGFIGGAPVGASLGAGIGSLGGPVGALAGAGVGATTVGVATAAVLGEYAGDAWSNTFYSQDGGSRSSGFANKRTLQTTKIKGNNVSVDAERGGSGSWNVHVKVNGDKYYITDPKNLEALPKSVRTSEKVQKAVDAAFEYIEKAQ